MRIVLDAMGSDDYPIPDVEGAVMAAREWGNEIVIVGREEAIWREMAHLDTAGLKLEVVHATEVIEMDDEPAWAAREKKNSSMHLGMNLVCDGKAEAYVTAGNTGGVLAVATLHTLRRIRGVKRPVLVAILPMPAGRVVTLDIGANADCRPEYLLQFALMGDIYARAVLGCTRPSWRSSPTARNRAKGTRW